MWFTERSFIYFSWLEMLLNVLFSCVPRALTVAMIAIEIPAAMRPYSMAVAPVSSIIKRSTSFLMGSPFLRHLQHRRQQLGRPAFDQMNSITKSVDGPSADNPYA